MANAEAPGRTTIYRIDVAPRGGHDPIGDRVAREAALGPVSSRRIYFVESPADAEAVKRDALPLLADGVADEATLAEKPSATAGLVEVHVKPGVMDPTARSAEEALRRRGLEVVEIRTGRAFTFKNNPPRDELERVAKSVLSNGVIERVTFEPYHPTSFEHGTPREFTVRHAELLDLDDDGLKRLSRDGHLFLSLTEMQAVQSYFRNLGREPTDAELETVAQTWSEHCVHKTLKSKVTVKDAGGKEIGRYGNLIRATIFGSTQEIIAKRNDGFCLSVFKDNAGVVAFDDEDGVCFKVETHNRPSAIEPYGGAATGIGGVIRDVLGTGLGAKPVANTDVFCVAPETADVPASVIPPARVLDGIVSGVRDYGNRMGIPTVNGAIVYHDDYVANPLVFCGCVGVIPRDKVEKEVGRGDRIVIMGGRTGRDGIHGATFSSAELTDTHGDEFSHAVQIGNAITEKTVADVLLQARDRGLFTAVTDCGAGGLSSAIGEMGEKVGAFVELDKVPLKYAGLRYDEVWISEAQERMVLSVPADKLDELMSLCESEDVEATDIGHFGEGEPADLILHWNGTEVANMTMAFLHDGIPMPEREAVVSGVSAELAYDAEPSSSDEVIPTAADLLAVLRHPNVASKHRVVRQYDTEVQAGTIVKPFVGPMQIGPADAAVIRPKLGTNRGVAVGCGLAPEIDDPYAMAVASTDEAIRNVICVGGDLSRLALLDNFCWPGTDDPETLGTLVRACEACRDVALAFGTPFVSGKDSLHNQFTDKKTGRTIRIPRTLLISAIAIVADVNDCVTSDLKQPYNDLVLIEPPADVSLEHLRLIHQSVAKLIASGSIAAAHDVSDGGALVAVAEMCIGGNLGADLTDPHAGLYIDPVHPAEPATGLVSATHRGLGGYVLETPIGLENVREAMSIDYVRRIGSVTPEPTLKWGDERVDVADLRRAWRRE